MTIMMQASLLRDLIDITQIRLLILVNIKMEKDMDLVNKFGKMVQFMRGAGRMIWQMGKVD